MKTDTGSHDGPVRVLHSVDGRDSVASLLDEGLTPLGASYNRTTAANHIILLNVARDGRTSPGNVQHVLHVQAVALLLSLGWHDAVLDRAVIFYDSSVLGDRLVLPEEHLLANDADVLVFHDVRLLN